MLTLVVSLLAFSFHASAKEEGALPYLGPGSEKMTKEQYEKVYKTYIQTSILLGYPLLQGSPEACEKALNTLFRQGGLFGYPVPGDATGITRSTRQEKASTIETYESAGTIMQLQKNSSTLAPERLIWVNSGATKATRRLSDLAKKEVLTLETDKVTGLQKVKNIPVGYPHMFLGNEGQGLLVKILKFNGKKEGCTPLEFLDNAWAGGFNLDEAQCAGLQSNVEKVWKGQNSTGQFYKRELARVKEVAIQESIARGTAPAEAKKAVEKYYVPPFASEINVVGTAMRSLAQCNLMALGKASGVKKPRAQPGNGDGANPGSGEPTMDSGEGNRPAK